MVTDTQNNKIPPGYKQTEVGVIPNQWEVKKLRELFTIKNGFAFSSLYFSDRGPIVLTPGNFRLDGGLYFNDRNTKRYSGAYSPSMQFNYGDLLVVMTDLTPECNLLGKPAFVRLREPILHNQRIGKLFLNRNTVSANFLYWFFLSDAYATRMRETATGSTVRHTSTGSIYSTLVALPPTEAEQEAIAQVLSDADALIGSLEKLIAKKRALKQGAMQELLTGKRRLPGFDGKWAVKKLGKIGLFRGGGVFPNRYQGGMEGTYPFYKVSDMNNEGNQRFMVRSNNWIDESTRKQISANTFPKHTIVFAKIGGAIFLERKKILSRESCIDNNMMGFLFDENLANYRFIHYLFLSIQLGKLVSTTALPSLNAKEIAELQFGIPKTEEQNAIAAVLSDMDAEIDALEQELAKYKLIKIGTMQNLLTGKIRLNGTRN